MNKKVTNTVIACVAFMALVVGLSVNRILSPDIMTRDQLSENGLFVYEVPRRFKDFNLIDQDGQPFNKEDLRGKWSMIFFGFTSCPDICPTTMGTLNQLTQRLEKDGSADQTQVVMISVDPQRDTPEKLKEYVSFFNEDYLAATGEYIDLFNLARQLNVAFQYLPGETEEDYQVSHSGEIILINPEGHFHGFFKSSPDPAQMEATFASVRESWARG